MTPLFRQEALQHQTERLWGEVLVCTPLPTRILTLFLASVLTAVALFLAFGSYARKQTVHGYLQPDAGVSNVFSGQPGRIARVHVTEAAPVEPGQLLVTVATPRFLEGGQDTQALLLSEMDRLLAETTNQIALEERNARQEAGRLHSRLASYNQEKARLTRRLQLLANRTALVREQATKAEALFRARNIPESELLGLEDELYSGLSEEEALQQSGIQIDLKADQARSALESLQIELGKRTSALESRHAELTLRRTELQAQGSYSLKAPIEGRISGLYVKPGEYVGGNTLLLSILPDDARLEAILYAPTRAIGFVRDGQSVHLYYDAFPHQRFGMHAGRVTSVSGTVRTGADIPPAAMVDEPVYQVTVDLAEQSIHAFGEEYPLQAGMQLRAELLLERRSLMDWVLEPLYSVQGAP